MSFQIIIPRGLHKEVHPHHCPIHARNKCKHPGNEICNQCVFQEDNEVCGKTLRGTNLDYHDFPCVGCMSHWRNHFGGDILIDALVDLEQAARHAKVEGNKHLEEREAYEAETSEEAKAYKEAQEKL